MKIAKRDIAIVMVVLALIAVFCAYKFSYSPNMESVDAEKAKQNELQVQIDEIKIRAKEAENMQKVMTKWQGEVADSLKPYHNAYLYEDGIMYLHNLEMQKESTDNPFDVRIVNYTVSETGIQEPITGQGVFAGSTYLPGTANYSFTYRIKSYDDLKKFINYMVSEKDGSGIKTLNEMSFSVEPTIPTFEGNIIMTAYSISDGEKQYTPQDLSKVEQGITEKNIWGKMGTDGETNNEE